MSEVEQFLAEVLPTLKVAEKAIHDGDVEPRLALWSREDPVTLFGAKLTGSGWAALERMFREVASWFRDSVEYDIELIAAGTSGDLAYTVAYEHNRTTVEGTPRVYTLRATQIYRREAGRWRVAHRHADVLPNTDGPLLRPEPVGGGPA